MTTTPGLVVTRVVRSPHDGGYYLEQSKEQWTPPRVFFRTSKQTWPTFADAKRAHLYGDVKWSRWS